jgi:hypothetical protein
MQKNSRLLYQSNTTITSDWNVNLQGLDKPQSFRIFNSRMIVGLRMKTCHTLHGIWRAVLADHRPTLIPPAASSLLRLPAPPASNTENLELRCANPT